MKKVLTYVLQILKGVPLALIAYFILLIFGQIIDQACGYDGSLHDSLICRGLDMPNNDTPWIAWVGIAGVVLLLFTPLFLYMSKPHK